MDTQNINKKRKGDKMNFDDYKVEFDLSTLNLKELVEVYSNITDFINFLEESKIVLEEKEI